MAVNIWFIWYVFVCVVLKDVFLRFLFKILLNTSPLWLHTYLTGRSVIGWSIFLRTTYWDLKRYSFKNLTMKLLSMILTYALCTDNVYVSVTIFIYTPYMIEINFIVSSFYNKLTSIMNGTLGIRWENLEYIERKITDKKNGWWLTPTSRIGFYALSEN